MLHGAAGATARCRPGVAPPILPAPTPPRKQAPQQALRRRPVHTLLRQKTSRGRFVRSTLSNRAATAPLVVGRNGTIRGLRSTVAGSNVVQTTPLSVSRLRIRCLCNTVAVPATRNRPRAPPIYTHTPVPASPTGREGGGFCGSPRLFGQDEVHGVQVIDRPLGYSRVAAALAHQRHEAQRLLVML